MSYVFELIKKEEERQKNNVELIASENFVSENVMKATGSCLTNKYAEGYPGHRYYGGCQCVDEIEDYCRKKWQEVFSTDYHCNVQPHSGSNANMAALSLVPCGSRILSMSLSNGGHLTHGSPVNFSGKLYDFDFYGVDGRGYIDYDDFARRVESDKPALIIAGASAYPREIRFDRMREAIDSVSASDSGYKPIFMVDMAHIAGLVAAGAHISPFGYADVVTTTTHKTLRGPRGGMIFARPELGKKIDSAIFPSCQGGPLEHIIAAKAVAAEEALTSEYRDYIFRVKENASAMAQRFIENGFALTTDGTDNHLMLLDFSKSHPSVSGRLVQETLDKYDITANKNCVPDEKRSPVETSGLRIGTPAMTTKGWKPSDFVACADRISEIINSL